MTPTENAKKPKIRIFHGFGMRPRQTLSVVTRATFRELCRGGDARAQW